MEYNTFINLIEGSEETDWIYDDDFGRYVLQNDIRITIISDRDDNEDREFHEAWARNFPDSNAVRSRFFLCFNGNVIEAFYTAAVDGYRALIPYVDRESMTLTNKQYTIGKILNIPYGRFDEYLSQANIQVEN